MKLLAYQNMGPLVEWWKIEKSVGHMYNKMAMHFRNYMHARSEGKETKTGWVYSWRWHFSPADSFHYSILKENHLKQKWSFWKVEPWTKSGPENPSPSDKYTDPLPIVVSGLAPLPKVNPESASFEASLFFKTLMAVSNTEVIVFYFPSYIDWTRKW